MRQSEDELAFDSFVADVGKRLLSQAYVLTGSKEEAQDLTQEALLRAWKHWSTIGRYDSPEGWTRRVLHNLCIQSWKKTRRALTGLDGSTTVEIPEHHGEIAQAMRSLPGDQARALLMHDGMDMSVSEVATELKVPVGTVKSWLSRSRKLVAARLEQMDPDSKGR